MRLKRNKQASIVIPFKMGEYVVHKLYGSFYLTTKLTESDSVYTLQYKRYRLIDGEFKAGKTGMESFTKASVDTYKINKFNIDINDRYGTLSLVIELQRGNKNAEVRINS